MNLLQFLLGNHRELSDLIMEHLFLVIISMGIAILIGVPLGILLTRRPNLSKPVLGFANIMQTVPSLALFGFWDRSPDGDRRPGVVRFAADYSQHLYRNQRRGSSDP